MSEESRKDSSPVTVIIATRDRPALLEQALASIRLQTVRERIGEVIISEGGSTLESREICNMFPDLPIRYFDHRPPLAMEERVRNFTDAFSYPNVALLHDDDWWAPGHLSACLSVLDAHPECAAAYSSYYHTYGPENVYTAPDVTWLVWIVSDCDFRSPSFVMNEVDVMLACLITTTLHFSTLVGRKVAMRDAYLKALGTGNSFDTDRTFPVFLSGWGSIGYSIRPDTFVRLHAAMDSQLPEHATRLWELIRNTTRWLLQTEPLKVEAAVRKFNDLLAALPLPELPRLRGAILDRVHEPQWTTLVRECGLHLPPKEQLAPKSAPTIAQKREWFREKCLPPILFSLRRRLGRIVTPTANNRNLRRVV